MELDGPEAPPPGVPSWLPPLLQGRQRSFEETVEEEKRLAPQSAEFLSRIASLREDKCVCASLPVRQETCPSFRWNFFRKKTLLRCAAAVTGPLLSGSTTN